MITPIEENNILLEKSEPLNSDDKASFAYFGVNAKILPPFRILNPQNIIIGDYTAIREGCHLNAFRDLSFLREYIDPEYQDVFSSQEYKYDGHITIDRECQIGRFSFMSCTKLIHIEHNVVISERVFIGDNNHSYKHPEIPIMQQPNNPGKQVLIGRGSWVGVNVCILPGVCLGQNTVVGANSVVRDGTYPSHVVIAPPSSVVISRMCDIDE